MDSLARKKFVMLDRTLATPIIYQYIKSIDSYHCILPSVSN